MIAGEFAVLEKYQKLVVMAVDRFVYATLEQSGDNRLSLHNFDLTDIEWAWTDKHVVIRTDDDRVRFVENAMTVVYSYLAENNILVEPFHLKVRSELDDTGGQKYGLGSSAAVVTAVIAAVLKKFLPQKASQQLIFKLASISHVITQGNGSGADVAASSHGGMLQYSSFQADWLLDAYDKAGTITELAGSDWPYFSLSPTRLPENLHICIGWTGSPASTSSLIQKIRRLKDTNELLYEQFLSDSGKAVGSFLDGVQHDYATKVIEGVRLNRQALSVVGKNAGVDIETSALTVLCDLAEKHGGAGKPSGAGGGDCGIAFMPSEEQANELMKAWKKAGIKPLDLTLCSDGAVMI